MKTQKTPLPADVRQALDEGKTIEAIKLLHTQTDLGLREAKDTIDAHLAERRRDGSRLQRPKTRPTATSLPIPVVEALERGNKIEAIRLLRESSGLGLKEAKDVVESSGILPTTSLRGAQRSGNPVGRVICLVFALALAYYFLRR